MCRNLSQFSFSCLFPGLEQLRQETRLSQRAAFAGGTQCNLRSQLRSFLLFCAYFKLKPFPACLHDICCYAQFLSRSFKSVRSISNYISGVKLFHILSGFEFPHIGKLELKLVIRGIAKLNPYTPRQVLPISHEILVQIRKLMDISRPFDAAGAFVVAFFLFARKSNLVPVSWGRFNPEKDLCRGDLLVAEDGILVIIKWSKTIQAAERRLVVPVVTVPNSVLCPRAALINLCRVSPAGARDPAFLVVTPAGQLIITHKIFTTELRRLLRLAGHRPDRYSGHSFRRGGASFALRAGVPGELIKQHGDWRSNAYLQYLSLSTSDKSRVTASMVAALPQ